MAVAAAVLAGAGVAPAAPPRLAEREAVRLFLAHPKVADWVGRYPADRVTEARLDRRLGEWTVRVWWGPAGEIARGRVDDGTGRVTEAWTGPQVAWTMARGIPGAFGGKEVNSLPLWLGLSAAFLLGLADLRRPLSLRNLDLLALLFFSVSLWFFNQGRIFTSVPLVYPPLLYLLSRSLYVGLRDRAPGLPRGRPVWVLAAATVFLVGFRLGLVIEGSNVIDVGYSGVIGAHRIAAGQAPYGHFPREQGEPCGPPDRDGRRVFRIQPNGRCEAANEQGDTYGPVAYLVYLPGYALLGWKGKGDDLDAARLTAALFDLLCVAALALVGHRYGGRRGAVTLAFAWAAYPFTLYALSSSSNDAVLPAFLLLAFWLGRSPWARGVLVALAAWTKFAPLLLVPLWMGYPEGRRLGPAARFAGGFAAATAAAFSVLLLEPDPLRAATLFFRRTIAAQMGRDSPFSLWDWGQYRAGLPDLEAVQIAVAVLVSLGALALAWYPRRRSPLQLAALTAALLIGFQMALTHWFYLYLPWLFPFAALALVAPPAAPGPVGPGGEEHATGSDDPPASPRPGGGPDSAERGPPGRTRPRRPPSARPLWRA